VIRARDHSVLYQPQPRPLRRSTSRARAAEGQQTAEVEPTQSCANQTPGPQRRMNRAIARQSSPIVVFAEQACHAGGRGFESRRSRFWNPLGERVSSFRQVAPVSRKVVWQVNWQVERLASLVRPFPRAGRPGETWPSRRVMSLRLPDVCVTPVRPQAPVPRAEWDATRRVVTRIACVATLRNRESRR